MAQTGPARGDGITGISLLGKIGRSGPAAGQLKQVGGVAFGGLPASEAVYVLDSGNGRVDALAPDTSFLFTRGFGVNTGANALEECVSGCRSANFGSNSGGQLASGAVGEIADANNLFVVDTGNNRLFKVPLSGGPPTAFGALDGGSTQLNHPTGVAYDDGENTWVVDQRNHRIVVYSNLGAFIKTFGWGVEDGAAKLEQCTSNCRAGISGNGPGQLNAPTDIAADQTKVWVTDPTNSRVNVYDQGDPTSAPTSWPSPNPVGIAIDLYTGTVVIADRANNRVEEYGKSGALLGAFGWGVTDGAAKFEVCTSACRPGIAGAGDGQFNHPNRVTSERGIVYVSDSGNNRIEKFGFHLLATDHSAGALNSLLAIAANDTTILLTPGTYELSGDLVVSHPVVLEPKPGSGGNARNITIDAAGNGRGFDVQPQTELNLSGMTIRGGMKNGPGGGVLVESGGSLTLNDSTVAHNTATTAGGEPLSGGGISNAGQLLARDVTVRANFAQGESNGDGGDGGGVANGGLATLINTTIAGNTATALGVTEGGGLFTADSATTSVYSSTIAGNVSGGAGGNVATSSSLQVPTIVNSIVAQGSAKVAGTENCNRGLVSGGGNLEDRDQCNLHQPSDQHSKSITLGPLTNNGGPVATRAIKAGSPAQNRALNAFCDVFDERGFVRKASFNPLCDVGAFEFEPKPRCTLRFVHKTVKVPKPATLTLRAKCDQDTTIRLTGRLAVKKKGKARKGKPKKKPKAKIFSFALGPSADRADRALTFNVKLPVAALKLLRGGAHGTASFKLSGVNGNGAGKARAGPARITLVRTK